MLKIRLGRDQQGFHLFIVMLAIAVLGAMVLAGIKVFTSQNNTPNPDQRGPSYQALQNCGDSPALNTMPMDPSKMEGIAPLGGVDPPAHTLPTDHMYMMYPYGETTQKDIYAPADAVITTVSYGDVFENGVNKHGDYRVDFYACSELKIIFGHIDTLSEKIMSVIGTPENASAEQCSSSTQGSEQIRNCNWDVDITLTAGELLGTSNGWDLWATYEGHEADKVTSPEYYHNTDAVCPLDYFTPALKTQLYAMVKRDTSGPKCGEAYQDKAGTLQGGWFAHKDPDQAKTDWSSHFSLVHHSQTGIGSMAIAGKIADQFMYTFTPAHDGTINREPSETTTGTVYCYQHEGNQRMPNGRIAGTGKLLLELADNHTMQIEHTSGSCQTNESLSSPTTYYR
jgi:hypothetical protein